MAAASKGLSCTVNILPDDRRSSLISLIDSLSCVSRLEVVIPASSQKSLSSHNDPEVTPTLEPKLTCFTFQCSLSSIVNSELLGIIQKTGSAVLLSQSNLFHEDSIAITSDQVTLSLTKDTYQRAGLIGQKLKSNPEKYLVRHVFGSSQDSSPSPTLDRIKWAFSNTMASYYTFRATFPFSPDSSCINISKSLLAGYLKISEDLIQQKDLVFRQTQLTDILVPKIEPLEMDIKDWSASWYEWLGMVSLGSPLIKANNDIDSHLSHYFLEEHEPEATVVNTFRLDGLITAETILGIWDQLMHKYKTNWFALQVYADKNAPAWKIHGGSRFQSNTGSSLLSMGTNSNAGTGYTIIKLPDSQYMTYKLAYS